MNTRVENTAAGIAASSTLDRLLRQVRAWAEREALKQKLSQERRQLAEMSDDMLRDLGIDRAGALAEAAKTDIPAARLTLANRT